MHSFASALNRYYVTVAKQRVSLNKIYLLYIVSATGNDLRLLDDCICPGHNITFQCTTVGGGITVWQGTAFDCPQSSNEIALRHAQFWGSVGVCNGGDICAHADSIQLPDCYTSNLTVYITPALEGRTVRCEYDNGITVKIIRSFTLNITRSKFRETIH